MREILASKTYRLGRDETVPFDFSSPTELRALDARVWITRGADVRDYWVEPGVAFEAAAGERLWISVDDHDGGRVELSWRAPEASVESRLLRRLRRARRGIALV